MQTDNRIFDDIARVASGALNALGGVQGRDRDPGPRAHRATGGRDRPGDPRGVRRCPRRWRSRPAQHRRTSRSRSRAWKQRGAALETAARPAPTPRGRASRRRPALEPASRAPAEDRLVNAIAFWQPEPSEGCGRGSSAHLTSLPPIVGAPASMPAWFLAQVLRNGSDASRSAHVVLSAPRHPTPPIATRSTSSRSSPSPTTGRSIARATRSWRPRSAASGATTSSGSPGRPRWA